MYVCLNGTFLLSRAAKISVFDHGFLYGDGVYETLRTYNGKVWQMEEHLRRLERSARALSIDLPATRAQIAIWTEQLLRKNRLTEARIRVTLTRGVNAFDFVSSSKPTLLIHAELLRPEPESVYRRGVKIVTARLSRTLPQVKSTSLLSLVMARQVMARARAYETIFVDDGGYIREGTITNIFLVKNSVLLTPKTRILPGTTRATILKLARQKGRKALVKDFTIRTLRNADEAFLTNSVRGIIPVRQVDGGITLRPGPVTRQLMEDFYEDIAKKTG